MEVDGHPSLVSGFHRNFEDRCLAVLAHDGNSGIKINLTYSDGLYEPLNYAAACPLSNWLYKLTSYERLIN